MTVGSSESAVELDPYVPRWPARAYTRAVWPATVSRSSTLEIPLPLNQEICEGSEVLVWAPTAVARPAAIPVSRPVSKAVEASLWAAVMSCGSALTTTTPSRWESWPSKELSRLERTRLTSSLFTSRPPETSWRPIT